jgi:hypothetical protein
LKNVRGLSLYLSALFIVGQSIAWIGSGIGRLVDDGRWVFHGIILFNNTQSESLSLLNNSIGLSKDTAGNEPHYIWLLE